MTNEKITNRTNQVGAIVFSDRGDNLKFDDIFII